MKTLLFLTPELPYPGDSGGKLKSMKLLQWLSREYRVTLACPLKLDDSRNLEAFNDAFPQLQDVLTQRVDVRRSAVNLLCSYARGVPLNVLRSWSPDLARRVAAIIDRFDMVFIDHYEVGQYVPDSYRGRRVYHAHNAYHKLWERYADHADNRLYRVAATAEACRVQAAEVSLCNSSHTVFASPNDIEALVSAGAEPRSMRETYHLGDDSQLALPALEFERTGERLLYVGNLAWEPNAAGLRWFIDAVWPRLLEQRPGLELDIVGRNPDVRLCDQIAAAQGIRLLGFVADLETVYPRSRVCIAPLTFGAGMKVKVLSALARGIPMVTTSIGAEGIAARHGEHLMIADRPEAMSDDILRLLDDAACWRRLADAGRALVAERYTWDSLFARMQAALDEPVPSTPNRPAWAVPSAQPVLQG